jgi:hypothetical protein
MFIIDGSVVYPAVYAKINGLCSEPPKDGEIFPEDPKK